MKTLFFLQHKVILFIAIIVFAGGLVLTALATFEFAHSFQILSHTDSEKEIVNFLAITLLKALDLFLFAIVFFVFSFGIMVLFNNKEDQQLPQNLPKWLHIEDFIELKAILWEAVLTTLVVAFLTGAVEKKFSGMDLELSSLLLPGAILLISLSLYLLKKK